MTRSAVAPAVLGFSLLWLVTAATLVVSLPGLKEGLGRLAAHRSPTVSLGRVEMTSAAPPAGPPAPAFVLPAGSADRERAANCLAQAIYYEAGFEPENGQRAVAQVVLNRVRDRNFPNTVCGVVYQGAARKTGCQFSFVCDGSLSRRPPRERQWIGARALAEQALGGYVVAAVGTATHYHTEDCDPWWRPTVVRVAQIGAHVFYRWPGKAGLPSALKVRYAGGEARFGLSWIGGRHERRARRGVA